MKNIAAIIPARGGSKGIPGKNLIDFCGKPLIAWSIEQAKGASSVSSVWVTSDSHEILEVASRYGARSVLRPASISDDTATSESAWLHALDEVEKETGAVDLVVAMQATSPLRESRDLEKGIQVFNEQTLDSLFSCAPLEDFFMWTKEKTGEFNSLNYDYKNRKRRQDISTQWVENGSFYIFKPGTLRKFNNRLGGKIGIVEMDFWKTFEIDCLKSLDMCSALMKHYLILSDHQSAPVPKRDERTMNNATL